MRPPRNSLLHAVLWLHVTALAACGNTDPVSPEPDRTVRLEIEGEDSSLQLGQSLRLVAVMRDGAGNPLTGRSISWSSSDTDLATVDADGRVTALATGGVRIVASAEGTRAERLLTIRLRPVPSSTAATVHVHADDPTLVTLPTGDGRMLQVFGEKDENGAPLRVTRARRFEPRKGAPNEEVLYNAEGLPTAVLLGEAGQVFFEHLPENRVRATFVLPDGTTAEAGFTVGAGAQGQSPAVRLKDAPLTGRAEPRAEPSVPGLPPAGSRASSSSGSTVTRGLAAEQKMVRVRVSVRASAGNISVPVSGALVQHHVSTTAFDTDWLSVTATEVGDGIYESVVPVSTARGMTLDRIHQLCDAINYYTGVACSVLEQSGFSEDLAAVCSALLRLRLPRAELLAAACTGAVAATVFVCSPVRDLVCTAVEGFETLLPDVGLSVDTLVANKDFFEVQRDGFPAPLPERVDINIPLPLVISLGTQPTDPVPHHGYYATLSTRPAVPGLGVNLSVAGSDGYSHSRQGLTDSAGTFELWVLGAKPGTQDVITCDVDGQTRTVGIVF